jgi:hypothetical protein
MGFLSKQALVHSLGFPSLQNSEPVNICSLYITQSVVFCYSIPTQIKTLDQADSYRNMVGMDIKHADSMGGRDYLLPFNLEREVWLQRNRQALRKIELKETC